MADVQAASQQNSGTGTVPITTDEALTKINRELKEKAVAERAKELLVPYIDLSIFPVNPDVLHVILPEDAKRGLLMPFYKAGKKIRVAVNDPQKPETAEILQKLQTAGYQYELHLASDIGIQEAHRLYESEQYKPRMEQNISVGEKKLYEEELKNLAALKEKVETLPAEEALIAFHTGAIQSGASDIHYQPEDKFCTVRFRIDGVLYKVFEISRDAYANLANQLKYKAKMKLNITNVPQDGRFSFVINDRKVDVRVSSLPTEFGESIVCRILDSGKHFATFEDLGFSLKTLEFLKKAADISHGMVLCTGPTGSGKTTTLYALLTILNRPSVKIITLEDPIEYHLEGITQSQVNEKRDYTFASGLRSILRQDPDTVMIGEIRDRDTAETACQAALTGHLLLSTLHTNSAVETIPRLLTIGVPPFMLAPSLHTIIAQRLVRRICQSCVMERAVSAEEKKTIENTLAAIQIVQPDFTAVIPERIKQGKGCDVCNGTGFRGQVAIAEVLFASDEIKESILSNAPSAKIFEITRKNGMLTMQEDGVLKVLQGITTLDEVYRVTTV